MVGVDGTLALTFRDNVSFSTTTALVHTPPSSSAFNMGQLCGRPDMFEDLGQGRTLGSAAAPPHPASTASNRRTGVATQPQPGRTLGGSSSSGGGDSAGERERREAMAKAAEQRSKTVRHPWKPRLVGQLLIPVRDNNRQQPRE